MHLWTNPTRMGCRATNDTESVFSQGHGERLIRVNPGDKLVSGIGRMTQAPTPHETTHWTARGMAEDVGMGVAIVQRIGKAHGLAPHRWRAFKPSADPALVEKLNDIVRL